MLFSFSCKKEKITEPVYESFVIEKGKHRTDEKLKIHRGLLLKFSVIFDSTAIYTCIDAVNQHSINKLFGFSDCDSHHQNNSARIGWRWFNERLELHAYCYNEKSRESDLITSIDIGQAYECSIEIVDEEYVFKVDGKELRAARSCNYTNIKYYLFPYFGGNEAAPHDIKIKIAEYKEK